jgi:hypothetical protein
MVNKDNKLKKDLFLTDNFILKLTVIFSLIGIILLFILNSFSELEVVSPSKINDYNDGENIFLKGKLDSFNNRGKVTILKISEVITSDIIVFESIELENDIGKNVLIKGVVRENSGKKELFATSIQFID